ncbi:MAG: TonB-dependent receptor [Opitutus sp.]|nr:TonB-dependent receptor [Opitutus sp.]
MNPDIARPVFCRSSARLAGCTGLLLGCLIAGVPAATAQTSLSGTVSNAATGRTLEGARIAIHGSAREAVTDYQGVYRFDELASGNLILSVSYTGLDAIEVPFTVRPGFANHQDVALTSAIYKLDKFVVAGEREGNARAVTLQRQAPNVKNVVSSDAFGSLAGNPAELLERLTGVVVERVGGDARFISIRGIPGELNSVQIDGNRRAAPGDRGIDFASIGTDHVESIELTKSPTPDMDADAIGGQVNLKSRSAFDLNGRRMSYSLGVIEGGRYRDPIPAGTVSYSDVFNAFGGGRNLGISFTGSFRQHMAAMDFTTMNYQNTTASPAYMYNLAYDGRMSLRRRWGGGLKLDYKISNDTAVFANFTYTPHGENGVIPVVTVSTAQTVATLNAQGQPTGTGAILPGYTDSRTEARPVAQSQVALSNLHRQRDNISASAQFGGRIRKPAYEVDYDVSYSSSDQQQYLHTATMAATGVGWVFDRTRQSRWTPEITFGGGVDPSNLNNYSNNLLTFTHTPTLAEVYGAQINFRKPFSLAVPAFLKAGAKVRREEQGFENRSRRWRFTGRDGILNSGDENLAQFRDLHIDYRPFHGVYPSGPLPSPDAMRTHKDQNPSLWQEDVAFGSMVPLTGKQDLSETVSAAYLLGNVRIERVSILAGLRFEKTKVEGEGPLNQITAAEKARRAAFTGPLTDAETVRRNIAQYGSRRTVSSDYQGVFPGVHLKYEPINRVIVRGSYATSIGRPAFTNIIPNDSIDEDNRIVTASNPGLKPQYSNNFDATAEYYFEPAGLFSVGMFLKEIKHYIFNTSGQLISSGAENGFDGQYAGYELRSKANGGFARIKGWEANYQQRFAFLPGWWSGFGAFANYTWLDTEGNYGGTTVQTTSTLAGFVPKAANCGVSYIRNKMNFRVSYGFNSEALAAFNAVENLKRYKLATHRIDVKIKYVLTRSLDIYVDLYNVTNDKLRYVWGSHERPQNILDRNDPQIHAGINGRF